MDVGTLVKHRLLGKVYSGPAIAEVVGPDPSDQKRALVTRDGKQDSWLVRDLEVIPSWWLALCDLDNDTFEAHFIRRTDDRKRALKPEGWNYGRGYTTGFDNVMACGTGLTQQEAAVECQANWMALRIDQANG